MFVTKKQSKMTETSLRTQATSHELRINEVELKLNFICQSMGFKVLTNSPTPKSFAIVKICKKCGHEKTESANLHPEYSTEWAPCKCKCHSSNRKVKKHA